jgi:hypothetical protein
MLEFKNSTNVVTYVLLEVNLAKVLFFMPQKKKDKSGTSARNTKPKFM